MPDRIATARQSGEESSLREKVARAIEPDAWQDGKRFHLMGSILARDRSLTQADAAIAVCMEEAARAVENGDHILAAHQNGTTTSLQAARTLRSLIPTSEAE